MRPLDFLPLHRLFAFRVATLPSSLPTGCAVAQAMAARATPTPPARRRWGQMLLERARLLLLLAAMTAAMVLLLGISSGRSQEIPAGLAGGPSLAEGEPLPALDYDLRFVSYDAGRMTNAAIPFVRGPIWAASPFIFAGSAADRERAMTCLAGAVWYEAGDDEAGEQAVAQVVINRVLHPAFPKSVCGVVFQRNNPNGSCQFTFTCDGSLRRVPSAVAWQRARIIAERALLGFVYAPVGTATFYHADYVVPYWSRTYDKIARVKSHLFYRMRGDLGRPGAFIGVYQGFERVDPRMIALNQALRGLAVTMPGEPALLAAAAGANQAAATPAVLQGAPNADLRGSILRMMDNATGRYVLQLNPAAFPGSYALAALALCREKPECTVMGWLQPQLIPSAMPSAGGMPTAISFLYRKDGRGGEQLQWNCHQVARSDPKQCMAGTAGGVAVAANAPA